MTTITRDEARTALQQASAAMREALKRTMTKHGYTLGITEYDDDPDEPSISATIKLRHPTVIDDQAPLSWELFFRQDEDLPGEQFPPLLTMYCEGGPDPNPDFETWIDSPKPYSLPDDAEIERVTLEAERRMRQEFIDYWIEEGGSGLSEKELLLGDAIGTYRIRVDRQGTMAEVAEMTNPAWAIVNRKHRR